MSEYPEHDKAREHRDDMQAIGSFLEWLADTGRRVCDWVDYVDEPCPADWREPEEEAMRQAAREVAQVREDLLGDAPVIPRSPELPHPKQCRCEGTGKIKVKVMEHLPVRENIEQLLAQRFDIDYEAYREEKEQIYQSIRATTDA